MIPIEIDISPILMSYSNLINREAEMASFVLDRVLDSYMFEWENLINSELKSTRQEYKSAMFLDRTDEYNAVVGLRPTESSIALMIEEGASSYDIKKGMEKSSKRKIKEDGGWYITVPFRHATTEALAESSIFSGRMPAEIQAAAQAQPINVVTNRTAGLSIEDLPSKYQSLLSNPTTGVQHRSPIYQGLIRQDISSTNKENRSGYVTFRRISDKSQDGSWEHPGFQAKNLMDKALNSLQLDSIVGQAIDDFIKSI